MAWELGEDGIRIDTLIYLGGDTLKNVPENQPDNVSRIINIRSRGCLWFGCLWDGEDLDRAENVYLEDVGHSQLPTHCQTLTILREEVLALAATVPVPPEKAIPKMPLFPQDPPPLEEAPTPRPVNPLKTAARDEWDFLKPVTRLGSNAPAAATEKSSGPTLPQSPGESTVAK